MSKKQLCKGHKMVLKRFTQITSMSLLLILLLGSALNHLAFGERNVQHVDSTTESNTWWCPMRGKPCELKDFVEQATCDQCGMKLITKSDFQEQEAERKSNQKTLGVILYPGFELLDVFGPVEMWNYDPNLNVIFVAEKAGRVNSIHGMPTIAEFSFETCPKLDIMMVPGGMGTLTEVKNEKMLEFLKAKNEETTITTSVCSGSWILAQAGLLDGRKATSNKLYFDEAKKFGTDVEWVQQARWVDDGKLITSSGVSAGMDMALHLIERLHGTEQAELVAKITEYNWNRDPENDPFAN